MADSTLLQRLMTWYAAECNGDWEHQYGVTLKTLDNPGWRLEVDLTDTELEDRPHVHLKQLQSEDDWLICTVQRKKNRECQFAGSGDPTKLDEILSQFLDWAEAPPISK